MNAKQICWASERDKLVVSAAADMYIQNTYGIDILKQPMQPELENTSCMLADDTRLASKRLSDGMLEILLKEERKNPRADEMVLLNVPSYFASLSAY